MSKVWEHVNEVSAEYGYGAYTVEATCPCCGLKHMINLFAKSEAEAKELGDGVDCDDCELIFDDEEE